MSAETLELLETLAIGLQTDKNTTHSYLPVYDVVLKRIRHKAQNVIEIGVYDGGSLLLWKKYFSTANIYGLDINFHTQASKILEGDNRIKFHQGNAYTEDVQNIIKSCWSPEYDFIIDDGPHTLESMIYVAENYSKLLTVDGILIIEDIQDIDWLPKIIESFPEELKPYVYTLDRRSVKGRYDDILLICDKSGEKFMVESDM